MAEPASTRVENAVDGSARPRRVVTGHDAQGRSIIVSDGPAPHEVAPAAAPAMRASVMWVTDGSPAATHGPEETAPADLAPRIGPPPQGVLLRIANFPPDSYYDDVDMVELLRGINHGDDPRDGVPESSAQRHFWFHKTPTLDFAIVLEGEIWAMLDEDETCLRAGDVLIQRGTSHSWSNRTDRTTRMAFVLIDGSPDGG